MAFKHVSSGDLGCVTWLSYIGLQLFSVDSWMASVNAGGREENIAVYILLLSLQWRVKLHNIFEQASLQIKVGLITHCRGWWETEIKTRAATSISSADVSCSFPYNYSSSLSFSISLVYLLYSLDIWNISVAIIHMQLLNMGSVRCLSGDWV